MKGCVAAGHPLTAEAGVEILREGGNAVDAAVAAVFASFVAEPCLVNAGGGGYALVVEPGLQPEAYRAQSYDFTCVAPSMKPDSRANFQKVSVDFGDDTQDFHIGRAAVAVPGVVEGMSRMLDRSGTMSLAGVMAPAIRMASEGIQLTPTQAVILGMLFPIFRATPALRHVFSADGVNPKKTGEYIFFPNLAKTLTRLGHEGSDYYYRGDLARAITEDQHNHGGLVSATDLAGYQAHFADPLVSEYRGRTVLLPPPSSLGGTLIGFTLKLLSHIDLAGNKPQSVPVAQALAEAMRLTNLARINWGGIRNNTAQGAMDFLSERHVAPYSAMLHDILEGKRPPLDTIEPPSHRNTSHISVMDAHGMTVSVTTSAGESSGFIVGETGMLLNNFLGEEDLNPGGFHLFDPGQRIMSMMSPVVVLEDGSPILAVGSAGSNRLRSAILQVILNVIDFGMTPHEAIFAHRLHFENGVLHIEGGYNPETIQTLEIKGYKIKRWRDRNVYFGGVQATAHNGEEVVGAGDPRRGGFAMMA